MFRGKLHNIVGKLEGSSVGVRDEEGISRIKMYTLLCSYIIISVCIYTACTEGMSKLSVSKLSKPVEGGELHACRERKLLSHSYFLNRRDRE